MSLTKIIKINPLEPEEGHIVQAAKLIASGGLVIIPTETVYGIAANALDISWTSFKGSQQGMLENARQRKNQRKPSFDSTVN